MIRTVEPGLLFFSSLDGFSRLIKKNASSAAATAPSIIHAFLRKSLLPLFPVTVCFFDSLLHLSDYLYRITPATAT